MRLLALLLLLQRPAHSQPPPPHVLTTTTLAGALSSATTTSYTAADGAGAASTFAAPGAAVLDAASGGLLLADGGLKVRGVSPAGATVTIAGAAVGANSDGPVIGGSAWGALGAVAADGAGSVFFVVPAASAIGRIDVAGGGVTQHRGGATGLFSGAMAFDATTGTLVVALSNRSIARVAAAASASTPITLLAGSALATSTDSAVGLSAGFAAGSAALAVDAGGAVWTIDGHAIRRIDPVFPNAVTTFAGASTSGATNGAGSIARFSSPGGLCVEGNTIYVADSNNHLIRLVTPAAVVTTLAGFSSAGLVDARGTNARFNTPTACAASAGTLWVAELNGNVVRAVDLATLAVTTLSGGVNTGFNDGLAAVASFFKPAYLAFDAFSGALVLTDGNAAVRRVNASSGAVNTLHGAGAVTTGLLHASPGRAAAFRGVTALAVDDRSGAIYVADAASGALRRVLGGAVTTVQTVPNLNIAAGVPQTGGAVTYGPDSDSIGAVRPPTTLYYNMLTQSAFPAMLALDAASGNLLVGFSCCGIWALAPGGAMTFIVGGGSSVSGDGLGSGPGASAANQAAIAWDAVRGVGYAAERSNANRIRRFWYNGSMDTLAGRTTAGFANGTAALFSAPVGLAVEPGSGAVLVGDSGNLRIRAVFLNGTVVSLAGSGASGQTNGWGTSATFRSIISVAWVMPNQSSARHDSSCW